MRWAWRILQARNHNKKCAMTCQERFALPTELLESIAANGLDYLSGLLRIMVNEAVKLVQHTIIPDLYD